MFVSIYTFICLTHYITKWGMKMGINGLFLAQTFIFKNVWNRFPHPHKKGIVCFSLHFFYLQHHIKHIYTWLQHQAFGEFLQMPSLINIVNWNFNLHNSLQSNKFFNISKGQKNFNVVRNKKKKKNAYNRTIPKFYL